MVAAVNDEAAPAPAPTAVLARIAVPLEAPFVISLMIAAPEAAEPTPPATPPAMIAVPRPCAKGFPSIAFVVTYVTPLPAAEVAAIAVI